MKISCYLGKTRANGYIYIYLRQSYREKRENKSISKYRNLFSFGEAKKALETMYSWRDQPETFPEELKAMGMDLEDLEEWILTLQTQVTKTGKPFLL